VSIARGERPSSAETLGLLIAFAGLVYLVFPGLTAPPFWSSVLMAAAGVAWAFYTLRGRGSSEPLAETSGNFLRSVPMIVLATIPFLGVVRVSTTGMILAVLSGVLASGVGYAVWYSALRYHTVTRAAVLQLSVPVIAAIGGVLFLSEALDVRLAVAGVLILGGIGLTILKRSGKAIGAKIPEVR
jgi:drug/metabolite transporter (DMT)-like permease